MNLQKEDIRYRKDIKVREGKVTNKEESDIRIILEMRGYLFFVRLFWFCLLFLWCTVGLRYRCLVLRIRGS